ncbi:MAG: AAC(3) family N-acetyltransferase [Anaerolineae bacterium]|nr:AAC(3) family N-acetyltransferase [Anaerolineae bacterium]
MLTFAEFKSALESLDLGHKPAIAHASLKSFGAIQGGAKTVLQALAASVSGLIMPTFTYKTMVTPEIGPPNNGITYGANQDLNRMTEGFHQEMPTDPLIGMLSEALRQFPGTMRTTHPILSFAGLNSNDVLDTQTIDNPFAPIGALDEKQGWVLLFGVDHTVNTSMHYAEKLAGRAQFVRWALTQEAILECASFPGCSNGFETIRTDISQVSRLVEIGASFIEAIPLRALLRATNHTIKRNPRALLCLRDTCKRCKAVRQRIKI